MALGVVLLAGAGVLLQSLVRLLEVDPGFRAEQVAAFDVALPERAYDDPRTAAFFEQLDERLTSIPGVTSSGAVNLLPLNGNRRFRISFDVDGRPPAAPGETQALDIRVATPGYLTTVGIPLRRGRLFTSADRQGSQPVALLNEAAVREHFPNEDPIGKRIVMGWERDDSTIVTGTVVGIVGDVKQASLDVPTVSEIWFPHAQLQMTDMAVVVKTQGDPGALGAAVRRTVQGLDADLPVSDYRTMESVVARSVAQPRLYATLLTVFAALALLLAALGVFGVMTYSVAQRTREIGIRMALGAAGGDVVGMIVRGGLALAGAGVVIGLATAFATRVLRGLLFGVSATDPATFAAVAVLLFGVALVASWIPARAATRIDPNVALRAE
jgi:putative ABC transport system permease protein